MLGDDEALVDTAAKSGLIGKPALDRLVSILLVTPKELRIQWLDKPARALGVGGVGRRTRTIDVALVPFSIGGVRGLLEVTVVQVDVLLLLPITVLRAFKSLVNLGELELIPSRPKVTVPMREVATGNVAVSIAKFKTEGWTINSSALSVQSESDFVLPTSCYLNPQL